MLGEKLPLWTQEDIIKATQGEAFGPSRSAYGCAIDSREISPDDMFIAIRGGATDGHHYIKEAIGRGASIILIDHWPSDFLSPLNRPSDVSFILVKDTFETLWSLARYARARLSPSIKITAITGSVGKTTTKKALAHILEEQGCVAASAKSLNTKLGVPLSLIRSPKNAKYGVFEVGMSQKGEIAPLSELIKPHVAIITMLAPAHFEAFSSLSEIAQEKLNIVKGLPSEGIVILNHDMPLYKEIFSDIPYQKMTFGRSEDSDLRLLNIKLLEFGFMEVTAQFKGEISPFTYVIEGIGEHFAFNTLGALLAAYALGANVEKAIQTLKTFTPEIRRGKCQVVLLDGKEMVLLDESYNANPTSMRAALSALSFLPKWKGGRMVAVLGDMLELGEQSAKFHQELSQEIKKHHIHAVYTCGPMMEHLHKALPKETQKIHVDQSQDLFKAVKTFLQEKDNIMVKGSLGMKMDKFVKGLKGE
ncbi:MAG: UDP-N-acetylmuramoyl-tripeptide--D-alanyl-D-alanine ligase [Proteobacteria bacterium]|nr:UDP-N-acetylmuramoyl-tripeptide--D-alanyl-D-alanine ligase [Pseudomonadota bacterium]